MKKARHGNYQRSSIGASNAKQSTPPLQEATASGDAAIRIITSLAA